MPEITPVSPVDELVKVEILPETVTTNDEFKNQLKMISEIATKSKADNDDFEKLLMDPDSELDEVALSENQMKLEDAMAFVKRATAARGNISKVYNQRRDAMLNQFDQLLESSGFNKLVVESERSKKFKKDAIAHRTNKRWEDLKQTFDANLTMYPILVEKTPNIARFSTFRINNPKLVNGQKNFKITDRIRGVVNNTMAEYAEAVNNIIANPYNLNQAHVVEMLRLFDARPDVSLINSWAINLQNVEQREAQREAEAKRIAEAMEQQRLAELKKAQEAAQQPQPQPQPTVATAPTANVSTATPITQDIKVSDDPYSWLADYALTTRNYSNFRNNDLQKIGLINDLISQMSDKSSPVQQNINSPKEMIELLKYVLL